MKRFFLAVFALSLCFGSKAQQSSELIEQANQLLTDGKDYPAAISMFAQVLNTEGLSDADKVRASYGMADAKLRESQVQVNKLGGKDVPSIYREYIYESVDHLLFARENIGLQPGLENSVTIRINSLEGLLTRNIMQLVKERQTRKGPEKALTSKEILRTSSAVQKLNPDNYSAWDYQGQVQLTEGDSANALTSLKKAVTLYESGSMGEPDAYAGYMYYRVALLQNNFKKDLGAARSTLQKGIEQTNKDREAIMANTEMKQMRKDMILPNIDEAQGKIDLFLVDLLIRAGAKTEEEKTLIEETVAKYPDNVNLMFQYAKMISEDDPKTATEVYDMIIKQDPANTVAIFNAGVLHYNMAASVGQEGDLGRSEEGAMQDRMLIALEYFKRAAQLGQRTAIQPILQIAEYFGDDELYQQYAGQR